jgi:hypothetical protein
MKHSMKAVESRIGAEERALIRMNVRIHSMILPSSFMYKGRHREEDKCLSPLDHLMSK